MKKGLARILVANMIYLVINILNNLLLPKFLSIDTYASIKTYNLYIGYAGFLSLGYADGMYLKYGGKDYKSIDNTDLNNTLKSYIIVELAVSILILLIGIALHDFIFQFFAVGSFLINIIGYYKNFYQATGEYGLYGKALNYQTVMMFALNSILLFLFHNDESSIYIAIQVFSAAAVAAYLTIDIGKKTHLFKTGRVLGEEIKENIKSGFSLMLGNFSSSIFTSLDRWFVKLLMSGTDFAYYSFAVSLENIINVFITPITISLYNTFCKERNNEKILRIKKLTLMWGFVVIAAVFPVRWIVIHFLTNYTSSLTVISYLFAAQAFYAVIKGIHVNLYKADHKQKKYFVLMILMIVIAVLLNGIFYYMFKTADSFALATLATAGIWFIYCEIENKDIRLGLKHYVAIIVLLLIYFLTTTIEQVFWGFILYVAAFASVVFLLMHESFIDAISIIKDVIKGFKNKLSSEIGGSH